MKIILLTHVGGLGKKGDVKEVSDGYYQNFLAPRKMALPATNTQVDHIHTQQAKAVERLENMKESSSLIKEKIEGKIITILEKASSTGNLYAAVRTKEIRKAILEQLKADIPEKNISVEAIKTTGDFPVTLHLYGGLSSTFTLQIRAA